MADSPDSPVLSRPVVTADIPDEGMSGCVTAHDGERADLIARLDLVALQALRLDYELAPAGRGRFRLTGRWTARAAQTCGVTLEPIAHAFDEAFSIEFWTPGAWERHVASGGDVAAGPDEEAPEVIENGVIDPGHLLEQLLIVALPPFPRREDAQLNWREGEGPDASPFAVLRGLSPRNHS